MFSKKRKLEISGDPRQRSLFSFVTPSKKMKTIDNDETCTRVAEIDELRVTTTSNVSDIPAAGPSKPETPKTDRKFKAEWKEKFPFIRYDSDQNQMFCKVCEVAGRNNIWTSGCDKMKVDSIRKHALTSDHKFALSAQSSTVNIEQAILKAAEKERDGVEGLMKNLYYLAQRNEPSSAINDLNKLLVSHHVSRFESLARPDKTLPYGHHESVREMQEAMSGVARAQLIEDIKQSGMFSVMCDESTDVSTEKTLILYVRYAQQGRTQTKFLEVAELNGDECTAKNLCETIIRVIEMRNLDVENIACVTTDGASVMTGVRGGVTTLMKQRNGLMLSVHCIAHRLALASGQSADSDSYLRKYQAMINTIYKYYHYSPKHQSKLKKIQAVYEMAERKFKQTFHTRWLSFEGAVDAVVVNYDALVTCLEMDVAENEDPVANGLLKFITDYRFLYTSYMLKDVLSTLCILSKIFQKRDLTVSDLCFQLKAAIGVLRAMKTVPGPFLKSFTASLPEDYLTGFDFGAEGRKNRIRCSQNLVCLTKACMEKYLDKLLDNLHDRFKDNGTISCFSVFDPTRLPATEDELHTYGNEEVHTLAEFYSKRGSNHLTVHADNLRTEWSLFKYLMHHKYRSLKFTDMAESVLTSSAVVGSYPNVCKLIKVCLILPVSSADCERGFSRYNLIKTKPRNRLYTSTVNTLMMLTVDTPTLDNMEQFNFSKAFELWATAKARRTGQFNRLV